MIIQCPACTTRYRIRPEKLPADGGNIKCPSCAHVFHVSLDSAVVATTALFIPFASQPSGTPLPASDAASGAALLSTSVPVPSAGQRWKVKNDIGLIFDFTETDQLRRWLSSRESVAGLAASRDGGTTWLPLSEHPELSDVQAGGRRTMMGMGAISFKAPPAPPAEGASPASSPTGPQPASPTPSITRPQTPTAEELRQQAQARLEEARRARQDVTGQQEKAVEPAPKREAFRPVRPARNETEAKTSRTIYLVAAIVLPLLAVVALNITGVINLRDVSSNFTVARGGPDLPPPVPARPSLGTGIAPGAQDEAFEVVQLTPQQQASQVMAQAAAAYAAGELPNAAALLERALFLDPNNRPAACELAKVYRENEQPDAAANAQRRCDGDDANASPDDEPASDGTYDEPPPSDEPSN
jgi:predicted Zn finger-like uncharacterized protein